MIISRRRMLQGLRLLTNVIGTRLGHARPIVALWEMTYRCNMACCFCNEKNRVTPELDTNRALALIAELAELKTCILLLTGGEPTLRDDFDLLMSAIAESGMVSVLCTNGSNVVQKLASVLKADMIRISVDGYGGAHDAIRAAPEAFKMISQCVPLLVRYGRRPMLVTVVTRGISRENLQHLCRQARTWGVQIDLSMVVYSLRMALCSPRSNVITQTQSNCRLDVEGFLELLQELEWEYPDVVANPSFYKRLLAQGGLGKTCRALDVSLNIKPDGRVSLPCDAFAIQHLAGDMRGVWTKMQGLRAMKSQLGEYAFCDNCYKRCIAFPSMLLDFGNLIDLLSSYSPTLVLERPGGSV